MRKAMDTAARTHTASSSVRLEGAPNLWIALDRGCPMDLAHITPEGYKPFKICDFFNFQVLCRLFDNV